MHMSHFCLKVVNSLFMQKVHRLLFFHLVKENAQGVC
jgi:hypothetical protein